MTRLPDIIVNADLASPEAMKLAQETSEQTGVALSSVVTRSGLIQETSLANLISETTGLTRLGSEDLANAVLIKDVLNPAFAKASNLLLFEEPDSGLFAALVDPTDRIVTEALSFSLPTPPTLCIATETDIRAKIESDHGSGPFPLPPNSADIASGPDLDTLLEGDSSAPAIQLVRKLITQAADGNISDIHIEPQSKTTDVRYRKDGALHKTSTISPSLAGQAVSRIKVMANLDIAEKRLPQDGRIRATVRGRKLDLRVATTPTIHGEGIVLRLLGGNEHALDLEDLGLSRQHVADFAEAVTKPNGVLLVTGPTGSGKTTTLYAALRKLNQPDTKILTVEDPIEYMIDGINQVQVKPEIGLTYAKTLRSFLRQDPDVMMVGEIRDRDTADISIRAALTGHLVLSTLHTNSALGAINRLRDMGLESFLIASTLRLTSAQRLVRRLCPSCKTQRKAYGAEQDIFVQQGAEAPATLYDARGCSACNHSGVSGRIPIMEAVPICTELESMIAGGAQELDLQTKAAVLGHATLFGDGLERVRAGDIALPELERVLR